MKWSTITCGIVGGGIPFLLGGCLVGEQMVYQALHPTPPGMGACGMTMAVALFVIAVGTPLGAGIFAAVGWLVSYCIAHCQNKALEAPGEVVAAAAVEYRMDDNPYRSPQSPSNRDETPFAPPSRLSYRDVAYTTAVMMAICAILYVLAFVVARFI